MTAADTTLIARASTWPARYADICIEMKALWGNLSNHDVRLYYTQPEEFFACLKEKHGINRDAAEWCMTQIMAECGCAGEHCN